MLIQYISRVLVDCYMIAYLLFASWFLQPVLFDTFLLLVPLPSISISECGFWVAFELDRVSLTSDRLVTRGHLFWWYIFLYFGNLGKKGENILMVIAKRIAWVKRSFGDVIARGRTLLDNLMGVDFEEDLIDGVRISYCLCLICFICHFLIVEHFLLHCYIEFGFRYLVLHVIS